MAKPTVENPHLSILFSGQKVSIVADVAGTTTDPVYKPMEIYPLGPCILIDTAGFDDEGELGALRIEKTSLAAQKTELAIILFCEDEMAQELKWYNLILRNGRHR